MSKILQLDPQIPMLTPKGGAQAIALIDYSEEHDLKWVCALDEGGAIWTFANKDVRLFANPTMGRVKDEAFNRIGLYGSSPAMKDPEFKALQEENRLRLRKRPDNGVLLVFPKGSKFHDYTLERDQFNDLVLLASWGWSHAGSDLGRDLSPSLKILIEAGKANAF